MSGLLDDQTLWYVSRATGLVSLILLTITLLLGVTASTRLASANWPRFVTQGLHRNVSLFAVVLLVVHVAAVVVDDYVPIHLSDVIIPFRAAYRPFWLGLGVVSFDLLIVLVITSLLRQRLGYGTWRVVHWIAYASWPLAVVHGLGTGSDPRQRWALVLTVACAVVVLLAIAWRIVSGWPRRALLRTTAVLLTACAVAIVFTWAKQGPFAPGWSKRSGTTQSAGQK